MGNQKYLATVVWSLLTLGAFVGCSSPASTQPSAEQQQENALNDPMNYKPNTAHDISGGDITHFDHDGFNKDLNDALNP